MKTTASTGAALSIHRTQATDAVAVSTVLVRDGGARFYETAVIVAGAVVGTRRTAKKFQAGIEHDAAVAWARGHRDAFSARHAFWADACQAVAS